MIVATACTSLCLVWAMLLQEPAETSSREDLSVLLEPIREKHELPALAAVVTDDSHLVAAGFVGERRIGRGEAIGETDRFLLGSCTKSMTATLCAILVERAELRWDRTVGEAFPDLEEISEGYRRATLEQLLSHRGGLPDDREPDALRASLRLLNGDIVAQRRDAIRVGLAMEPVHPPGTQYTYSNFGYLVAAAMAERATGRSWEALMREHLFAPLGMATAGFGPPGEPTSAAEPWGHQERSGFLFAIPPGPGADVPAPLAPGLSVHASLPDWALYARFHLAARGQPHLLKAESFEQLHADHHEQGYALGWAISKADWTDGDILRHAGSNGRWYAEVTLAPKRNLAILIATNRDAPVAVTAVQERLIERFTRNR